MQRTYTIEVRVDYTDNDKNEEMVKAVRHAGHHLFAQANLLSDGQKPQIMMRGDDYFEGEKHIELFVKEGYVNPITEGLKILGESQDTVSDEMMEAAASMLKK